MKKIILGILFFTTTLSYAVDKCKPAVKYDVEKDAIVVSLVKNKLEPYVEYVLELKSCPEVLLNVASTGSLEADINDNSVIIPIIYEYSQNKLGKLSQKQLNDLLNIMLERKLNITLLNSGLITFHK